MTITTHEELALLKRAEAAEARVAQLQEACEPGKASGIVRAMFEHAERLGHSPVSSKHGLTYLIERAERVEQLEEALREIASIPAVVPQGTSGDRVSLITSGRRYIEIAEKALDTKREDNG